jgi:hypothetical protein
MTIQDTALIHGLSNDATNKLEESEMFLVDATHGVWMESCSVGGDGIEESIVRVEHLS